MAPICEVKNGLSTRSRYGLRIAAYRHLTLKEPVFTGQTAALLWGLPLLRVPAQIHVLTPDSSGGRSHRDVRKQVGSLSRNIAELDSFICTDKLRTAAELSATLPFAQAVAAMDSVLRPGLAKHDGDPWERSAPTGFPLSKDDITDYLLLPDSLKSVAAKQRATAVLEFSSPASESFGESISRAQIHLLHFPTPILQKEFTLLDGTQVRTDFFWAEERLIGEFDGKAKYFRSDWNGGSSAEDRLFAEKRREDGLRNLGFRVVRWTWAEAMDPRALAGILRRAGLVALEPGSRQRPSGFRV